LQSVSFAQPEGVATVLLVDEGEGARWSQAEAMMATSRKGVGTIVRRCFRRAAGVVVRP
jgi:hypothetical protein